MTDVTKFTKKSFSINKAKIQKAGAFDKKSFKWHLRKVVI